MTPDPLIGLPVYLINLPRAVARRTSMEQRLEKLGLAYELFPGVDGKAEEQRLLANTDVAAFRRNMGREILIGGIGCYHSHLAVWERFLTSGQPIALVLEDDVVFHDDFLPAVRLALQAQEHWDFLKLNCIRAKLPVQQGRIGPYRLNAYIGPATGTGAYLINRATAFKLLPAMRRVTRATDHEINRFFIHDFRLRGLEPFPSHPDDGGESLITGKGFAEVRKFPLHRRLPHYRLKAGNYLRRLWWLAKRGEIVPRRSRLRPDDTTGKVEA
ncbi:glycosyltransferase family 25 protein [Tabrizicola soli]|uniref:Glycosyltransferase family 25 protein n=1 Tax=Tabrizicola soli TaxID=2185115 RepID=A0ABV7DZN3_9RHOB|nr:glycosyltransferase family 25 protein [Tabrizicola soli]